MVMHIYDRILKSLTLRLQPNATSFLLISLFLLLVSLSLLLCLPFCFISLFLCGFPLFGEGQDFLLRSWLVSGRSQKTWFGTGTSWFATWYKEVKPRPRKKALCLDQACSQEAPGEEPHRELTRVSQCPSSRHQGPQRPEDLPRLPRAWMIGSGPGCPGYLSITLVSSKRARGPPHRDLVLPLGSCSQIPGFASEESTETRPGFRHIFPPHAGGLWWSGVLRGACSSTCFSVINSLGNNLCDINHYGDRGLHK